MNIEDLKDLINKGLITHIIDNEDLEKITNLSVEDLINFEYINQVDVKDLIETIDDIKDTPEDAVVDDIKDTPDDVVVDDTKDTPDDVVVDDIKDTPEDVVVDDAPEVESLDSED